MEATNELLVEPGVRSPAPGELRLVQAFVNTNDIEGGQDELATPAGLKAWLEQMGLAHAAHEIDPRSHARALAVREGLRQLALANNADEPDPRRVAAMNEALAELPVAPRLSPDGRWQLQPRGNGVSAFLARILSSTLAAMADGSWSRMKACQSDTCQWVFYDHSRNRSGHWCSMAVCGSRQKARSYRRRRRNASASA